MHSFLSLLLFAALVVILLQLPRKVFFAGLAVVALLWLAAPGPALGPLFGPGFGPGFGPHWAAHWHLPAHFWPGPHVLHGLVTVLLIGAAVWAALKFLGKDQTKDEK